jgi:hypothetical protein
MVRLRREAALGPALPLIWLASLAVAVALSGCAASSDRETLLSHALTGAVAVGAQADGLPARRGQYAYDTHEPALASLAAMSDAEAEALIARAITEHEMRRP